MDFDYFDTWLVCICKTDTIHLWKLNLNENNQKDKGYTKWLSKIFFDEKAVAK